MILIAFNEGAISVAHLRFSIAGVIRNRKSGKKKTEKKTKKKEKKEKKEKKTNRRANKKIDR